MVTSQKKSTAKRKSVGLSKSLYIKGLQCHKALWLHKYRPEIKDEDDSVQSAVYSTGTNVGVLAQQLFPGGLEVPYEGLGYDAQIAMTSEALSNGTRTLYEATFCHDGVFVKADILHKGRKGWELYEVKSSTGMKDVYLEDIALQYHVLSNAGVNLSKASLVHINSSYVRQGDLDVGALFTIADVTKEVKQKQEAVTKNLTALRRMLKGDMPTMDIGPHCTNPYECSFSGHCWAHVPSPSVFDFADVGKPNAFDLYRQGIVRMEDVPVEQLGWRQRLQVENLVQKKVTVDAAAVKEFLQSLWYPLCFLDFETTCLTPVPLYDRTKPFQPVPFQYSLHIVDKPKSKPRHFEFLAAPGCDPRQEFVDDLLEKVPAGACIVAWNQGFEIGRLKELANHFPRKKKKILALTENFRDLMVPFRQKKIYHWEFGGSYSIKAILPALVPKLSYSGMGVSNGEEASIAWLSLWEEKEKERLAAVQRDLLEYCRLDTLAMVEILNVMKKLAQAR